MRGLVRSLTGGGDGGGTPGPPGPPGADGAPGTNGADGAQGPPGIDGQDGADGPMGPPGAQGATGANGADGATGPQGIQGIQGPHGPQGEDGEPGPMGPTGPTGPQGPAGGGGSAWTTVEQNLGSTAAVSGHFVLTDAAIAPSSKVIVQQAPGPYTGKGTLADEATMDTLWCVAEPQTGQAVVHWRVNGYLTLVPNYPNTPRFQALSNSTISDRYPGDMPTLIGKTRGNIKFLYQVA